MVVGDGAFRKGRRDVSPDGAVGVKDVGEAIATRLDAVAAGECRTTVGDVSVVLVELLFESFEVDARGLLAALEPRLLAAGGGQGVTVQAAEGGLVEAADRVGGLVERAGDVVEVLPCAGDVAFDASPLGGAGGDGVFGMVEVTGEAGALIGDVLVVDRVQQSGVVPAQRLVELSAALVRWLVDPVDSDRRRDDVRFVRHR